MNIDRARLKAFHIANKLGQTAYVIELDHEEGRTHYPAAEHYLDSDEFNAFGGEVIEDVDPIRCDCCGYARFCECSAE